MNTIQTKNGVRLSIDDIKQKQKRYAKKTARQSRRTYAYGVIRALPHMYNTIVGDTTMDHYNLSRINAINRIKNMITADMSLYEVEKLVQAEAKRFIDESVIEHEGSFLTPMEYAGIKYIAQKDDEKRISNWKSTYLKNEHYDEFYFVVDIPQLQLKFDSRKKLFRYDKVRKVPVRDPQMAIYKNSGQARFAAQTKIIMAINKQKKSTRLDDLNDLDKWLSSEQLTLQSSFKMVDCIHAKSIKKFPALYFTLAKSMNNYTSYSHDINNGPNERFDERIVNVRDDLAHGTKPLTYYELEDAIVAGRLDDDHQICKESIEDAYKNDGKRAYKRQFADLHMGIDAYVSLAMSLDRMDLVDLATDYEHPECPMTLDIAEAVWNGEMLPPDAIILWGDIYTHKGVKRRGLWLRLAMDMLINEGALSRDEETIEEEFYDRINWLRQKYGEDRLREITCDFHNERTIYIHGEAYKINKSTSNRDKQAVIDHLGLQAFRPY